MIGLISFPIHHSLMRSAPRLGLTSNSLSKTLRSGQNDWTNYRRIQIRTLPEGKRRISSSATFADGSVEPCSLYGLANSGRLHHCSMQIRKASVEDTVEACQVVRRSIAELCHADHQDDPIVLDKWLSNSASHNMRSWIADPDSYVVVATEGAAIIGVGAVTSSGEITLNYVSPDAHFEASAEQS